MLWIIGWLLAATVLCMAAQITAMTAFGTTAVFIGSAWAVLRLKNRGKPRTALEPDYREPDADSRSLHPRFVHDETAKMSGLRIIIEYSDASDRTTQRIIRCEGLNLEQDGLDVTPFAIEAFCELRGTRRTFIICRIDRAWHMNGEEITELEPFLISHAAIPREGDDYRAEPFEEEDVDGTEVKLFYTLPKNPRGGSAVLSVTTASYVPVLSDGEIVPQLDSVSGHNAKNGAFRKIMLSRITNACDPETGEVIDDLAAWVEAHQV